jgi:hypothetical protein
VGSLTVEDFKAGVDRRRSILTAPPGALWVGMNVDISRGGEVEKRKAFAQYTTAGPNSRGLCSSSSTLFTFGPDATATIAPNVKNIQILHPSAASLIRIVSTTMFRGLPYTLALFSDGRVLHFYNGTNITAWYSGVYSAYIATDCVTLGSKIYVTANTSLIFCENDAPLNWGTNINGSGIIDMSTKYGGAELLTAVNVYISRLAVYSSCNVQIWVMDPDPAKNAIVQVLPNLGALAAASVLPFGDTDNFLLAQTGVRSLRARDMSLTAGIYDIGTPIDVVLNPIVRSLDPTVVAQATAVIEPIDGRYILAVGTNVFTFSYFPTSKVSAWTQYDLGGQVVGWGVIGSKLFCRVGNDIMLYGGANGLQYDACPVEVVLPYLDANSPGMVKNVNGIDMAMTGRWDIEVGLDPNPPYAREIVGRFDHSSFGMGRVTEVGAGTHFGARMTSAYPGPATLAKVVFTYTGGDEG